MAYRSDSEYRLIIEKHSGSEIKRKVSGHVYVINLPIFPNHQKTIDINAFNSRFDDLFNGIPEHSIVVFLSETETALNLIPELKGKLKYRLWVAIERERPLIRPGFLPDNHAAITVFTKHRDPFKHSKMQIQYTICPSCNKTTKDYGGKKHLYSPYGTLISDVWRDTKIDEINIPDNVLYRLAELFAVEPYKQLDYYDLRKEDNLFIDKYPRTTFTASTSIPLQSQLINGDCIDSMRGLPESSVDFIFADPPYNIKKKYDNWDDGIQIGEYFSWCDNWIQEIHRVLKPGKVFCLINIPLWVVRHYMYAKKLFEFMDYIVWEGLGLPVRNIMPAHYGILCLSKGNPGPLSHYDNKFSMDTFRYSSQSLKEWYCVRQSCVKSRNRLCVTDREPITNLWWDIHRLKHNSKRVDHPCQLPPDLMKRLIYTFTNSDDVVLDPFNGAGTTTLVAEMMNRKYIGIELSEKYHRIARERHREISNGRNPFYKKNNTPKSKNSRVQRLRKQQYKISKKTLQLEVRQIAQKIGRKPAKEDVKQHTKYPFEYFEEYFIDWGEVCAAVGDKGMNENPKYEHSSGWEQLALLETKAKYKKSNKKRALTILAAPKP